MVPIDTLITPIELRADASRQSPGRLYGVLLEYEQRAKDRAEVFSTGALSWPDDGVVLNLSHDTKQPLLRFTPELRDNRLVVDAPLPDTSRGRDAAVMVRDGLLRGLSVEFRALAQTFESGGRRISRARLYGAGLVADASYGNHVELRSGKRRVFWWL